MSNITIYDVAGAAKVSLATVSRVLNNPDKVKSETRERVMRVINDLGYRPNAIARGLASRRTTTVGIIVSDIGRASVAQMLGGIIDIAYQYKYSIKLFSILKEELVEDVIRNVVAEQVDGVLYLNDELEAHHVESVLSLLEANGIPIILANVVYDKESLPSVSIDYELAAYELTRKMINEGRKQIYLLSTVRQYTVNKRKEIGYTKAMNEANLEPKIFRTSGDISINRPHFDEFFKSNPIDGAIAVRDSIAISFMNVAREKGKRIPDDISIAGFQNTKYAILAQPTLTCIDIPVYDIGAVSMKLLTKLMNSEKVDEIKIKLPHKIVSRQTTRNN